MLWPFVENTLYYTDYTNPAPTPQALTLRGGWGGGCGGPSQEGLILNAIALLLPCCCGFFAFGHRVSDAGKDRGQEE